MRNVQLQVEKQLERVFGGPLHPEACDVLSGQESGSTTCFRVEIGGRTRHVAVTVREGPVHDVAQIERRAKRVRDEWPDHVFMVVAPYLTDRVRSRLAAKNVNYLDASGHALVRAPGVLVHLEAPSDRREVRPRPGKGPNPFAKKASYIPRLLLADPDRAWGVREMAREIPLSVGHVSNVLREMVRRGYASEEAEGHRLASPDHLLAHWTTDYRWDDNEIYSFQVPYERDEIEEMVAPALEREGVRSALTLLTASDRLAPRIVHDQFQLYVERAGLDFIIDFLASNLSAQSVSRGGNLHILQPYYRDATFFGARHDGGMPVVSAVQLFLDLADYPLRGKEAAQELLRRELGPHLHLSDEALEWMSEFIEVI